MDDVVGKMGNGVGNVLALAFGKFGRKLDDVVVLEGVGGEMLEQGGG